MRRRARESGRDPADARLPAVTARAARASRSWWRWATRGRARRRHRRWKRAPLTTSVRPDRPCGPARRRVTWWRRRSRPQDHRQVLVDGRPGRPRSHAIPASAAPAAVKTAAMGAARVRDESRAALPSVRCASPSSRTSMRTSPRSTPCWRPSRPSTRSGSWATSWATGRTRTTSSSGSATSAPSASGGITTPPRWAVSRSSRSTSTRGAHAVDPAL